MNTHDPAFRRAFRAGKRFFFHCHSFAVVQLFDDNWIAVPFFPQLNRESVPGEITAKVKNVVLYWNPDGKRWRRFNPEKMNKYINQEARP